MAFTDRKNPGKSQFTEADKALYYTKEHEGADAVSIRWKKSRISMSDIIKNGHNEIKNKYYLGRIKRDLTNFFKWMALAI